jgi:hypothetical protein
MSISRDLATNTAANYLWWAVGQTAFVAVHAWLTEMGYSWYFALPAVFALSLLGLIAFGHWSRRRLRIVSAHYGVQPGKFLDVTPNVAALVDGNRVYVEANNDTMAKGANPYPGEKKTIVVVYEHQGALRAAVVAEGGRLSLPY